MRFVRGLIKRTGINVLDVGCATGSLCRLLKQEEAKAVGLDINKNFIAAARSKDPSGEYHVGDMKTFRLRQKFDLLICFGTTLSYAMTNRNVAETLTNFRRHIKSGGYVVIDVLNAIAFAGPRPFQVRTEHRFDRDGFRATASIRHRLLLEAQTMTEQVSWHVEGSTPRQDKEEMMRLFFPQELVFQLEMEGFDDVKLMDSYGQKSQKFGGRRLIAVAKVHA